MLDRDTGRRSRARVRAGVPVRWDAVTFLTVYLVLTCALPSYLTVPALGSVGRPTTLWGLAGLIWWAWHRIGRDTRLTHGSKTVRTALLIFVACVLLSYALASFQGLPSSEASVADSGVLRMAGWAGVALIANDGIDSRERLDTLLRRIALTGGLMASLGLAQFFTGQSLIDWISLPGFAADASISAVQNRAGFVRSAGTATHPLEYGVVLCMALPIAISLGSTDRRRSAVARWFPVAAMAFASVLSVSRSALIGVAVSVLFLVPSWSKAVRVRALLAVVGVMTLVYFVVPGMAGTLKGLFMGVGTDSSTVSRTSSYDLAFDIASRNPVFGRGFLTFLPEYIILDNQFLGLLIELGYVGFAATLWMLLAAIGTAARAGVVSRDPGYLQKGFAVGASVAAGATTYAFFDGLSFPMSAALLFLMIGVAGAIHSAARGRP